MKKTTFFRVILLVVIILAPTILLSSNTMNLGNLNKINYPMIPSSQLSQPLDISDDLIESTAIVFGLVLNENGELKEIRCGAGFFVGEKKEGLLVTALHVVSECNAIMICYGYKKGETINIEYPKNPTKIYPLNTGKKYYWIDFDKDLVIFKLSNVLKTYPTETLDISNEKVTVGSRVYTCGHTNGEYYYKISESIVTGFKEIDYITHIMTEFTGAGPGNSGGALVNSKGEVVGILSRGDMNFSIQFSVPAVYINFLLSEVRGSYGIADKDLELKNYIYPDPTVNNLLLDVEKYGNKFDDILKENN